MSEQEGQPDGLAQRGQRQISKERVTLESPESSSWSPLKREGGAKRASGPCLTPKAPQKTAESGHIDRFGNEFGVRRSQDSTAPESTEYRDENVHEPESTRANFRAGPLGPQGDGRRAGGGEHVHEQGGDVRKNSVSE